MSYKFWMVLQGESSLPCASDGRTGVLPQKYDIMEDAIDKASEFAVGFGRKYTIVEAVSEVAPNGGVIITHFQE